MVQRQARVRQDDGRICRRGDGVPSPGARGVQADRGVGRLHGAALRQLVGRAIRQGQRQELGVAAREPGPVPRDAVGEAAAQRVAQRQGAAGGASVRDELLPPGGLRVGPELAPPGGKPSGRGVCGGLRALLRELRRSAPLHPACCAARGRVPRVPGAGV